MLNEYIYMTFSYAKVDVKFYYKIIILLLLLLLLCILLKI